MSPIRLRGAKKRPGSPQRAEIKIMVAVRIRPMMPKEVKKGELNVIKAVGSHVVRIKDPQEIKYYETTRNSPPRGAKNSKFGK